MCSQTPKQINSTGEGAENQAANWSLTPTLDRLDLPVSELAAADLQEQKETAKIQISISELQICLGFMMRAAIVTTLTGSISTSQQRCKLG